MKARVSVYSQIPTEQIRKANLVPVINIHDYLDQTRIKLGDVPIAVLPEGPLSIPYLL